MKLFGAIPAMLLFVGTVSAQTPISTFPYFYDWTNPAPFARQADGRTFLGGGDEYWGTYTVGSAPQFVEDSALGVVRTNTKNTYDTLFVKVDATGMVFVGNEIFKFDASRSGAPGPSGTLYLCVDATVIRTIDIATELLPTMQSFTTSLPAGLGNSLFTVSIVAYTNSVVSIDNTEFSGGALPVTLVSFTLISSGASVVLNWKTLTETDNYGFYVQKSDDRVTWADVDNSFQPGHGTTVVPQLYSFVDRTPPLGNYYRLRQVDLDGTNHYSGAVAFVGPSGDLPAAGSFALNQCYPNPFNPRTTISFSLAKEEHTTLTVYNTIGEEVATLVNEVVLGGEHSVVWDPSGMSSGTYFYVLRAGGKFEVRKMLYVR